MAPPLKVAPGDVLEGRFHVLSEIGRGGMAVVFKATDASDGRSVAVKVPLPQFSSGVGQWSMFQREVEIGERLDHPSILRFVPTEGRKRPYVVTEFLSGTTLASHLRGKSLPEAEALRTMSRICEAVAYLHDRGFVHYDLKPANVLLCDDGSLRLIDLGMAHEVVRGSFSFSAAPALATSEYVAPEQISRHRGRTSVDVYALGAMLYEMLTGRPPFQGDDPFVWASARQIGDPKAPRALRPDLSLEVEELVLRALRRDPKERYPSVTDLRADVDDPGRVRVSGLAARLVEVTPARKALRLIRFVVLTTMAPIAALLMLFLALWWWMPRRH
jgi:serine/threonine-protein kinase